MKRILTKKRLRRQLAALTRQNLALAEESAQRRIERDAKESQLAWLNRRFDAQQAESKQRTTLVRRIVSAIRAVQPCSALLPDSEHSDSSRPPSNHYRTALRSTPRAAIYDIAEALTAQPDNIEVLNDLLIEFQNDPVLFRKLIMVRIRRQDAGRNYGYAYKISETMLRSMRDREGFCQMIGWEIAAALFAELQKEFSDR